MTGKHGSKFLAAAGATILATWCLVSSADGAAPPPASGFALTSTTFKDGGMLPVRVAFTPGGTNPNCVGQNISPQLSWSRPPAAAKSFAISEIALEGGAGPGDVDLVVYGISTGVTSLAEGDLNKPSDKYVAGTNREGEHTWRGMCPAPGVSPHHYMFKIVAYDLDPKELPPGLTLAELEVRLRGHTKGATALIGMFARPK